MDKLTGFYKSLDGDNKTAWVNLINDNPTEAIKTYHKAFCRDDAKSKGYCDLLQLFRLLGTLEERKASRGDIKDIKRKVVEISKNQETEREQYQNQLGQIVEKMKNLQNTAVNADGTVASVSTSNTVDRQGLEKIHNALSVLDEKIESKSKQPTQQSSDTSNQEELERLKKQIDELENTKKEDIQRLRTEHAEALKKSNLSVEEIKKEKAELEESVKEMKEQTKTLNDEKIRIENISSMDNENKIAKINQLKQELEYAQAKHKAEIEKLKESTLDNIEAAALSAEEPGASTEEEAAAPAEEASEGDINTNKKISCQGENGTINAEFGKKIFTLYENAKDILHSDMLILIGCLHFYKLEKLNIIKGSDTEKILTDLENALFIQLTKEEYEKITSQLQRINKTLNETFIKICERDTNYKNDKNKNGMAIMVYALLWIFHFNKNIAINASISTYEQIISNKSLFDKDTLFINENNCGEIIAIGKKIEDSITKLKEIKDTITSGGFKSNLVDLKGKYNNNLQENKSVLALLKRRDDWSNDVSKRHKRFNLNIEGQNTIDKPLQLIYNDTPLVIPESTQKDSQNMTHQYDFYGFDSVYPPDKKNNDIASSLVKDFNFENDTRPLCFIGYGQSGSGKTSTLIYLDVPGKEQDGIIMELLKKLDPEEVTVSMIEIYEAEAAKASDESCIGIGTTKHSTPGKIVECNASNTEESKLNDADNAPQPTQTGGAVKERIKVEGFTPIRAEIKQGKQPIKPSMRYITIGEVLDKQFDEKGKSRSKNEEKDKETVTTFKNGSVQCPETGDMKSGWFYTHNETETGEECMDKNFGLKHYILMGFECREIAPTSNNKQSSRSHVVVSLKLHWSDKSKERYIYVCDLAGVENEFDCNTSGSADIIRMKAKTKANKNYSNIVGPGKIEDWKKLEEKRAGNIVKYVHKDVHISKTEKGPACWPDGTPNEAGDIDAIRLENSTELLKIFWHQTQISDPPLKMIMDIGPEKIMIPYNNKDLKDKIVEYFKNKLEKLPIKRDDRKNIKGFPEVKKNIEKFIDIKDQRVKGNRDYTFVTFLHGKRDIATPFVSLTPTTENMTLADLAKRIEENSKGQSATLTTILNLLKSVFNPIEMPDCKSSYEAGFKRACDIRTKEGYVINNTLAQLTRDVKRISKYAIKERLEKPTGKKETDGAEESPATYPCLFADTYDEYSKYSKSTHPLMNWYDIDDPLNEDFGSILTAMCLVSKHGKKTDWTNEEKLNLLKTFRFNYCTVLNETFMMRKGDYVSKTPAGNEIYVNNPPLPPYINVGILENSYKEYIFYENDPRTDTDTDKAHIEKKTELFLTLCKHFLNLIVKMFRHPIYENDAIKFMQELGSISNKPSIIFKSKEDIKELFKNGKFKNLIKDVLKPKIKEFINKIKTNNNATFIGTIQTTEQVNRVSDKIVVSEALKSEEKLNSIEDENINRRLLKRLFVSSYLTATEKKTIFNGSKSKYTRPKSNQQRELSAILYECLYEIRKLYKQENLPIASKTMKERDIDGMVSAIETAFPLMSRYLDPVKINNIWNLISEMERGVSVMTNKPATIYGETEGEYNSYPYTGDITIQKGGKPIGANQRRRMKTAVAKKDQKNEQNDSDPEKLNSKFIPTKPNNALSKFNEILINNLKDEPSLEYITSDVWNKLPKNQSDVKYKAFKQVVGIKKTKISLMRYLVTDKFFVAVYADYISQTFENNDWDADNETFTDFKPVKTAEARTQLSEKLSNNDYDVQTSYPPENTVQQGGADDDKTGEITTDAVVQQINKIGEKIDGLGGIDQSERKKHAEDLAKINKAVTELQTHLTELYSDDNSISTKLQEALQQLQKASREISVAEN